VTTAGEVGNRVPSLEDDVWAERLFDPNWMATGDRNRKVSEPTRQYFEPLSRLFHYYVFIRNVSNMRLLSNCIKEVLTCYEQVTNPQNYWVLGRFPSSGIITCLHKLFPFLCMGAHALGFVAYVVSTNFYLHF
jgi:hypothetical protein